MRGLQNPVSELEMALMSWCFMSWRLEWVRDRYRREQVTPHSGSQK